MSSSTSAVTFRATILRGGRTATGIEVPEEIITALGATKRPRVHATIAGFTYSHRSRHVLAIEGAKAAATRERRIAACLAMLREGRR